MSYSSTLSMKDSDLHIPCVLGRDFLSSYRVRVNFSQQSLTLLNSDALILLSDSLPQDVISFCMAVPSSALENDEYTVLAELLEKICFVYINYIVIYSHNLSTHLQDIQQVFMCLQWAGLTHLICMRIIFFLNFI